MSVFTKISTILCAALLLASPAMAEEAAAPQPKPATMLVKGKGGRVDWGPDGLIAFDQQGDDEWFDVWTMKPAGSEKKCLTCGKDYPSLHNGNPAWHPSGKFIVFQSLDERIPQPFWGGIYKLYTNPGAGVNNNIWIMTSDGARAWRMTDLGKGKGVLHAHFSPDGNWLVWAELTSPKPSPTGTWVIKRAAFSFDNNKPKLSNIETLTPGKLQFYETHSFTPDGASLLFTGMKFGNDDKGFDIYKYSFADQKLEALTDEKEGEWDEHAQMSPDGSKIIWMSSAGVSQKNRANGLLVRTDYWTMNADGTDKKRFSWFNDRGAAQHLPGHIVAADVSWSPDGKQLVAYVENNPKAKSPGDIVLLNAE
jgi:Tol biopolymer transport system component